jgi:hypothetical protein
MKIGKREKKIIKRTKIGSVGAARGSGPGCGGGGLLKSGGRIEGLVWQW